MRNCLLIIVLSFAFLQCKTQKVVTTESAKHKAPLSVDESVGFNEALVVGQLILQDDTCFFKIEKILKRGRTLPIISNGQTVVLKNQSAKNITNSKTVTGILRCKNKPDTEDCIWHFIPNK